jgi:hypothetical protein
VEDRTPERRVFQGLYGREMPADEVQAEGLGAVLTDS